MVNIINKNNERMVRIIEYNKINIPNIEYRSGNSFRFRKRTKDIFGKNVTVSEIIKIPSDITNTNDVKKYLEEARAELICKNRRVYKHSERLFSDILNEYIETKKETLLFALSQKDESTVGKRGLSVRTFDSYVAMLPRIEAALGDMKIKNITAVHIEKFMAQLCDPSVRNDVKYKTNDYAIEQLKDKSLTNEELCKEIEIGYQSLLSLFKKNNVDLKTANKVSEFLDYPIDKLFNEIAVNLPLSAKTINNHFLFISSVFTWAVKAKYIESSPCGAVNRYINTPKPKPSIKDEDISLFIDYLIKNSNYNLYAQMMILALCGCRRGEMLALRFNDFDLEKQTVAFDEAVLYSSKLGTYISSTKSSQIRTIKIGDWLTEIINTLKQKKMDECNQLGVTFGENSFLFTDTKGGPENPGTYNTELNRFKRKYNLEDTRITALKLRHHFATRLIENAEDINAVSRTLGHGSIGTTERFYKDAIDATRRCNLSQSMENIIEKQIDNKQKQGHQI